VLGVLSVRAKLSLVLSVLVLSLLAVSSISYLELKEANSRVRELYEDLMIPSNLALNVLVHSRAMQKDLFQIILEDDPRAAEELAKEVVRRREEVDRSFKAWEETNLYDIEKELIPQAKRLLRSYRVFYDEAMAMAKGGMREQAFKFFKENALPLNEEFNSIVRKLNDFHEEEGRRLAKRNEEAARAATRKLLVVSSLSVLLGLILGWLISSGVASSLSRLREGVLRFAEGDLSVEFEVEGRDEMASMARALSEMASNLRGSMVDVSGISRSLGERSEDFSALSEEANASVEEVKANVEEIVAEMESLSSAATEISSSVQEVASGSQLVARRVTEVASEVEGARESGERSIGVLVRAVASVGDVASRSRGVASEVRRLVKSASEIQSFVGEIASIADQTNLLALNAAIEAARAGEAGRGFAVVAEEVRKLAEESNEAARRISDLARSITSELDAIVVVAEENASASEGSAGLAREAEGAIRSIMEALSAISAAMGDVAAVSQEQASSSQEIARAVQEVASRVSRTASAAEVIRSQVGEVALAAERVALGAQELASSAGRLAQVVSRFRAEGGTRAIALGRQA